jgi:hypothetical protein
MNSGLQAHILFVYGLNVADRPIADFSDAEFVAMGHETDIGSKLQKHVGNFSDLCPNFSPLLFCLDTVPTFVGADNRRRDQRLHPLKKSQIRPLPLRRCCRMEQETAAPQGSAGPQKDSPKF